MYLSRIVLPESHEAVRLLADWHALHTAVLAGCPRAPERAMFRLEPPRRRHGPPTDILVQTACPPAWKPEEWPAGTRYGPPKPVPANYPAGTRLRFRLRANPTVKKKVAGRDQGRREGILGEEAQGAWLRRKAEVRTGPDGTKAGGGFRILSCQVVDEKQLECVKRGQRLSFRSVLFDGVLEVTDPALFAKTLAAGIGPGKAFGFGLLSVAPL